jgi:hypothetical protein
MPYTLIYDTPKGYYLTVKDAEGHLVELGYEETLKEIIEKLKPLENLFKQSRQKALSIAPAFVFLSPLVIKFDLPFNVDNYLRENPVAFEFINSIHLPRSVVEVKDTIKELVVFDVFEYIKDKFKLEIN